MTWTLSNLQQLAPSVIVIGLLIPCITIIVLMVMFIKNKSIHSVDLSNAFIKFRVQRNSQQENDGSNVLKLVKRTGSNTTNNTAKLSGRTSKRDNGAH